MYAKNERNMREVCCHSCVLPNVTAGIILWLVMSHVFSWIYHHVTCGLCREMMRSQNRDLIFRANNLCLQSYGIRAFSMLSTDSQMIAKWTAIILEQLDLFYSNRRSFLEEARRIKNNLWFSSINAQYPEVGFQVISSKNITGGVCHTHSICLIYITSICPDLLHCQYRHRHETPIITMAMDNSINSNPFFLIYS
jgi:hypothetical protein